MVVHFKPSKIDNFDDKQDLSASGKVADSMTLSPVLENKAKFTIHFFKEKGNNKVCFRDLAKLNLPMVVRF